MFHNRVHSHTTTPYNCWLAMRVPHCVKRTQELIYIQNHTTVNLAMLITSYINWGKLISYKKVQTKVIKQWRALYTGDWFNCVCVTCFLKSESKENRCTVYSYPLWTRYVNWISLWNSRESKIPSYIWLMYIYWLYYNIVCIIGN